MANRPVNVPTLVIAIVALLVSVLSLVVAFSRGPAIGASDGEGSDPPVTQTTHEPEATVSGAAGSTIATPGPSDTGGVNPQPDYTLVYEDKELRIPPGVYIDLDEPRVNAASGGDFLYYEYNDHFQNYKTAAVVRSPSVTAQDCADAIQTSPLTAPIAPREGFVMCIQTDAGDASEQGVSQKMARILVKSIDKQDTVTILVTAWNIPT